MEHQKHIYRLEMMALCGTYFSLPIGHFASCDILYFADNTAENITPIKGYAKVEDAALMVSASNIQIARAARIRIARVPSKKKKSPTCPRAPSNRSGRALSPALHRPRSRSCSSLYLHGARGRAPTGTSAAEIFGRARAVTHTQTEPPPEVRSTSGGANAARPAAHSTRARRARRRAMPVCGRFPQKRRAIAACDEATKPNSTTQHAQPTDKLRGVRTSVQSCVVGVVSPIYGVSRLPFRVRVSCLPFRVWVSCLPFRVRVSCLP